MSPFEHSTIHLSINSVDTWQHRHQDCSDHKLIAAAGDILPVNVPIGLACSDTRAYNVHVRAPYTPVRSANSERAHYGRSLGNTANDFCNAAFLSDCKSFMLRTVLLDSCILESNGSSEMKLFLYGIGKPVNHHS